MCACTSECDEQIHNLHPYSSILRHADGQFGFGRGHPNVSSIVSVLLEAPPAKKAGNAIGPSPVECKPGTLVSCEKD